MRRFALFTAAALLTVASTANARETRVEQSLRELINSPQAKEVGIDGSVRFYLAGEKVNVLERMGPDVTNRNQRRQQERRGSLHLGRPVGAQGPAGRRQAARRQRGGRHRQLLQGEGVQQHHQL